MTRKKSRRQSARVPMHTFATIETTDILTRNNQAFTVVLDVSRTGIGVRTAQPPTEGENVILRIGVGEEIKRMNAIVRRVTPLDRGGYDVGLEWQGCTQEDLVFLDEFTTAVGSRPA